MTKSWIANAAIAGVAMCTAPSLLLAQDATPSVWNGGVYATRSVWSGVYTAAQADRGKKMYQTACSDCHGDELEGDPGNGIPPLAGDYFMVDWENYPVSDLVRHIHFRPNDEADDMDIVTATDLVAYLLAKNQIPVGGTELPSSRAIQVQIRIDARKPEQ